MKALLILLLTFLTSISFANEIDQLQTAADVNQFLGEKVHKIYQKYPLIDITDTTQTSFPRFFKIDFDNNGLTDLFINGNYLLLVLDRSNNKYDIHYFNNGFNRVSLLGVDFMNQSKKIIIHQSRMSVTKPDTLIFRFGGFIEDKPQQLVKDFKLDTLRLRTYDCYGECPVFHMTIHKNRTVRYNAILFNNQEGMLWGEIPEKEFEELIDLLKYLNIPELNDKYAVNWTDDQPIYTDIIYNNTKKYIYDYGGIGTFGLRLLYKKMFNWRDTIDWKE
ncbi:DUF6438 domain-containing protein [Emticicia agri]|uniref:DUF6438 domain-containing protein n=1 Tax=Emticicia agri TaxID=2492393 RepID=A0A4Q5LT85_9BACT|nr:DUF6438 domain-containing protein [Emticicia agri]RYU92725.1 hypothetical protein EWM59_25645 [Emticicia agri]